MQREHFKPLSWALSHFNDKIMQLDKIQDISFHMTSDDVVNVTVELFNNNVIRYLITGTRCNMTLCFNSLSFALCRKPRGEVAWFTNSFTCHAGDILRDARSIVEFNRRYI